MSMADRKPDAVIVGAGIAGSALAFALAGSGHSVMLLEKSTVHVDRVRGEFIVTWARQRRRVGRKRMVADPELALPFLALQKGPFAVPSEAFSEHIWDRLLG